MIYPGGKNSAGVFQRIINEIPPHDTYIEAFAGSAAIFRRLRPASHAILIDDDPTVIHKLQDEFSVGLEPVEFVCGDAPAFLESYDWQGREFVYADPPYLRETLRDQSAKPYDCAFGKSIKESREAHTRLLATLLRVRCPVMLSGYANRLYASKLRHWRSLSFMAGTRGGPAEEWLWMNYPAPVRLHDYQYYGSNHRERTDFRRLVTRWRRKLEHMPATKREALISHLANLFVDPRGEAAVRVRSGEAAVSRVDIVTADSPSGALENA